ncbi:MAG: pirin family protein [Litorivicinaceae bacterium]|nr:MAG: pirin family protein [Litorivicinaceae bacterium]
MQSVETHIIPRTSDIGNLAVRRALPSREKRSIGSFVFWDQFGPGELIQDVGLDVRPHPHIGLSTLSYLFAGTMQHRDSLGNDIVIGPGAVNLMTAGSGIVHSERSDPDSRANLSELFGIQSWLALPRSFEETAASFDHYGESRLPQFSENGIEGRVLLGDWFGLESPVSFPWDSLYVDLRMSENSVAQFPKDHEERAIFSARGAIEIDGILYPESELLILAPGRGVRVVAPDGAHVLLFGGEPLDGPRHLWWNFVSSSEERIEQAKIDWLDGRFAQVPGDDEFIPLPKSS